MNANLLAPEIEYGQRSSLTLEAYPRQPAASKPKDQRSESRAGNVLRGLDQLSRTRPHLYRTRILTGGHRKASQISRYVFEGDQSGESPIRIGIFAGLRENDEVGPEAVSAFLADLVALPHLGSGLRIYAYPIVSATSFEVATSSSRSSQSIMNHIGCQIPSSEAYQIEREIFAIAFDGIITIHLEEEIKTFQVGISDARLHDTLVRPILSSLEPFLPNVEDSVFDTRRSLTTGVPLERRPSELALRVPSLCWSGLSALGLRIALHTAVDCYRSYVTQNKTNQHSRPKLNHTGLLASLSNHLVF
jgi:hypothetical protein